MLFYRLPLNPASTSVTARFGLCAGPLNCLFGYDGVDDVSVSRFGAFTFGTELPCTSSPCLKMEKSFHHSGKREAVGTN